MRKTIILLAVLAAFLLSASMASANHQKVGNIPIKHSITMPGFTHDGDMWASQAHELLTTAPPGGVVVLDIRSPWERNGTVSGCLTRIAVGMEVDPNNRGIPIWRSANKNGKTRGDAINIPAHVQGPIGIAFNAQTQDGTDLIGWPFRAVGYMIMNPDFDNYLKALEDEGIIGNGKAIIVMCSHGWRSKHVASYIKERLGYKKVYNLKYGYAQWRQAGYPYSTSEADWINWDQKMLYDPARLDAYGGAKWPNSVFMAGGDPVVPEWFGNYAPQNSMLSYPDPSCPAPGNLVGFNGPWPKDKRLDELGIVPSLTSVAINPPGWNGPTFPNGAVPGYFDEWPIENGFFIEGNNLPLRGEDDPCYDDYTDYFGPTWYPKQPACQGLAIPGQTHDCNPGDPLCAGARTYCFTKKPFGSGFRVKNLADGQFWTPKLKWKVALNPAAGP